MWSVAAGWSSEFPVQADAVCIARGQEPHEAEAGARVWVCVGVCGSGSPCTGLANALSGLPSQPPPIKAEAGLCGPIRSSTACTGSDTGKTGRHCQQQISSWLWAKAWQSKAGKMLRLGCLPAMF